MKTELYHFDVYPKVVKADEKVQITLKPLGRHMAFEPDTTVQILPLNDRNCAKDGREPFFTELKLSPDEDGCIRFEHVFKGESEHFIRLPEFSARRGMPSKPQVSVYSVLPDLQGRYPYLGDLHVHSFRSDGREAPEIVVADYRRQGYDFTSVSDHHAYVGSCEAIEAFKGVPLNLHIVHGEEVHMPSNDVHIINFGSSFSVNAVVDVKRDQLEKKVPGVTTWPAEKWRGDADAPFMTEAEYEQEVWDIAKTLNIPEDVDAFTVASCVWAVRKIHEGGGLAVFCHPYWINNTFHVSPRMSDVIFDLNCFDAFEVFGGERYMEQNESQLYHYMEARQRGDHIVPIGASDCHEFYNSISKGIGKTLVLAKKNETGELIDSMKRGYCVAVECISPEYRLCASLRLIRYGRFLLDNYFPLHDELCVEEGRLMREYAVGNKEAAEDLARLYGRGEAMIRKYFAI